MDNAILSKQERKNYMNGQGYQALCNYHVRAWMYRYKHQSTKSMTTSKDCIRDLGMRE